MVSTLPPGSFFPVSLSNLLEVLASSAVENRVNELIHYSVPEKCLYTALQLFQLLSLRDFRQQSYRKCCASLSQEDCLVLGFVEVCPGVFLTPCHSTLHDFALNRLGLEGLKEMMATIGEIACKNI
ncbi:MAG: hypothetical protein LBV40_04495 [Methanomicrobiales archaeon]|jgi:hypothetical protein|nr:hypothetical protein [Methanomicrobiales archaeon]